MHPTVFPGGNTPRDFSIKERQYLIPMDHNIKNILNVVVVIAVILWLLNIFGVLGSLSGLRIGR
ncbi:hypothetical protein B2D07_01050 [Desulfococcus multivorans]|nr:uncharacterized protein Dmul_02090 [Desulfococcus multivorans]AQU99504.1 hypothetical protein B2D07_01050 [Desulfococcus multivorans]